ncbi:hypothetical protein RYX36_035201 [Vicia faba]
MEELVGKLEAAVMDSLLVRDLGFDKDKIQVLFLHLGLDFSSLGYFKVVWDKQLVIEEELETSPELENVEDFSPSQNKDTAEQVPIEETLAQTPPKDV